MKIGIIGWYGHGNAGDERILYCLRRFFDGHDLLVTAGFNDATRRIDELNSCDYVLLGGGGLILRGINKHAGLIQALKPPLGCVGLGVEASHEDNAEFITRLKEKAEFILVRDAESRTLLQNHFKVIVGPDLTHLYPFDVVAPTDAETCGLNLRPWHFWNCEHGSAEHERMVAALKRNPYLQAEYSGPKWEPAKACRVIQQQFGRVIPLPLYL
jgi:hypothetical protein